MITHVQLMQVANVLLNNPTSGYMFKETVIVKKILNNEEVKIGTKIVRANFVLIIESMP